MNIIASVRTVQGVHGIEKGHVGGIHTPDHQLTL